jgi:O-antigen/teichoic acid export membrane protein
MSRKALNAGVISIGSLVLSQGIRFAGNIFLAKLLAPSAFGVVAIVNMTIIGVNLFSDLGLRQLIIQQKENLTAEYLNTLWVIQIFRGVVVFGIALACAALLFLLQSLGFISANAFADPLLPFLIAGASTSALFNGLESTKTHTEYRSLNLGLVATKEVVTQVISMAVMILVARATSSPWALVLGAVVAACVRAAFSHVFLPGQTNKLHFDKQVAHKVWTSGRWIAMASPLTFIELNGPVIVLGGLLSSSALGIFTIASLLAGVVHLVSQNLAANVFLPSLSSAVRSTTPKLAQTYARFQLIADALIVTAAGVLIAAGPAVVKVLFDARYAESGALLSSLGIGLVALRYSVIEQLCNAQGDFKLGPPTILCRIAAMLIGVFVGFHIDGVQGAALGIGLSWFAGWPILVWYRSKTIGTPWRVELVAVAFLVCGYIVGLAVTHAVNHFQLHLHH